MVESAANRALRLLDLVPYLSANQGATVAEVATKFEISEAEVIADLDLVSMCGLLGITPLELIDISHDDGVITVINPQNLDLPRSFNQEEVLLLQIALSALEDQLPLSRRSSIRELRQKLTAEFRSDFPEDALSYQGDTEKAKLKLIETAIMSDRKIRIRYVNRAKDETTVRIVSPIRVVAQAKRTLVDAWCDTARANRTFNLLQIEELEILDEPRVLDQIDEDSHLLVAKIAAAKDSIFVLENQEQLTEVTSGVFTIQVFQAEWIKRSILSAGGSVKVLEPADLAQAISQISADALANYT